MNSDFRKKTFQKSSKKHRESLKKQGKVQVSTFLKKETLEHIDCIKETKIFESRGEVIDYILIEYNKK